MSHDHECCNSEGSLFWPALSLCLLIAGIIFNHLELSWFTQPAINLLWFVAAFLPVGLPVLKEGWEAICDKDFFNEFTLMIVACVGAFCIGEYPEAVAVMLFYKIGEMLQDAAVDRATRNISDLLDVRPERTLVLRNGQLVEDAPQNVQPGEVIELKPGGRLPLDGTLLDTEASFDTSALTGESVPRTIAAGGEVLAGMIVCGQTIRISVTRAYDKSALSRILEMVNDAAERKAPAEMFIRRFARIYTPIVILLAVLIVLIPAILGATTAFDYTFRDWLYRGLVFLVISCPCALVISVPLGYFAGIGAASRLGILFKGGNYIDAITQVNSVAFDKTGTLTTGTFSVTDIELNDTAKDKLLALVLSVEQKSTHPIAKAVCRYAEDEGAVASAPTAMSEISGQGIEAQISGSTVLVGNLRLMDNKHITYPDSLRKTSATLVVCAIDGKYAGTLFLSDTIKPDTLDAISKLKSLGISDIHLLSGDKKEVVEEYAAKMGIAKAFGGLLPQDKSKHIEQLIKAEGRNVAFVGDGMNDAPVLALSNVGVAMGGLGSDAAIETADIVIQNDQPSKLATAITIGRATRAIVHQNIFLAIAIKIIVMIAGALGYASLWSAVFADVGVSLIAVLNSLRILHKRYE
jgi:Cd2+/Zn2+-exporting ATPase